MAIRSGYEIISNTTETINGLFELSSISGLNIPGDTGQEIDIFLGNASTALGANVYVVQNGSGDTSSAIYWESGSQGFGKGPFVFADDKVPDLYSDGATGSIAVTIMRRTE
jgi:hypothetical protein